MNQLQENHFMILSAQEFREQKENYPFHKELMHSLGSVRYCKAEFFQDYIIGTIRVPQKNEHKQAQLSFGFALTDTRILFIEDEGKLKPWLSKQTERWHDGDTPDQFLLQILEYMIEGDTLYLSHVASLIDQLEECISGGMATDREFFLSLTRYRQKLSEFHSYYEQLTDIGESFRTYDADEHKNDVQDWDRFTNRVERLKNHVCLLRESILQLRELAQSVQDARQNKTMGILTIVTTFFLPLTLLTGWYGMNFSYMPGLTWKYGYLAVVIVALLIAVIEIIYFKKKHFF